MMSILEYVRSAPIQIWRHETCIHHPARFGIRTPEKEQAMERAGSLLDEIFLILPENQEAQATKLATENEEESKYMWYFATATGHEAVAHAIKESESVVIARDLPRGLEDSMNNYIDGVKKPIFDATGDEQMALALQFLDEHRDEASQLLFDAAVQGHESIIRVLLDQGILPYNEIDPSNVPLHAACFNGNLECAKVLNSAGLSVNQQDDLGATPLMRAAAGGRLDIAEWLLDQGADPLLKDFSEPSTDAMVYASWNQKTAVARLLLERGAAYSSHAVAAAANGGDSDIFVLLLRKGGFPTNFDNAPTTVSENDAGLTSEQQSSLRLALEYCGTGGSTVIIDEILGLYKRSGGGASFLPKTLGEEVENALIMAIIGTAENDAVDAAKLLIEFAKESVDPVDGTELWREALARIVNDLLCRCAEVGSKQLVHALLTEHGADVNGKQHQKLITPLYCAVAWEHRELVDSLLQVYGADIHQASGKFANGPTALWMAVDARNEWAARRLLEAGGPIEHIQDTVEETARRVFVVAEKKYRAPVNLFSDMEPSWNEKGSNVSFLCLEYPEGIPWLQNLQKRRADEDLKDERELRPSP